MASYENDFELNVVTNLEDIASKLETLAMDPETLTTVTTSVLSLLESNLRTQQHIEAALVRIADSVGHLEALLDWAMNKAEVSVRERNYSTKEPIHGVEQSAKLVTRR